jgi:hypothetical protein
MQYKYFKIEHNQHKISFLNYSTENSKLFGYSYFYFIKKEKILIFIVFLGVKIIKKTEFMFYKLKSIVKS